MTQVKYHSSDRLTEGKNKINKQQLSGPDGHFYSLPTVRYYTLNVGQCEEI
jgi:hypothetical protein